MTKVSCFLGGRNLETLGLHFMAALVIFSANSGYSQSQNIGYWSQYWRTTGAYAILQFCAIGRQLNALGRSYWNYEMDQKERALLRSRRPQWSARDIENYLSGQAIVIQEVCPDVR
jgi:hypothetical protein